MKYIKLLLLPLLWFACFACEPKPVETPSGDDGIVIKSSKRYIVSDNEDSSIITVTMNGADVTADSKIYKYVGNESELIEGNAFRSKELGSYKVYAIYDGNISPKIPIESVTAIFDVPEDPKPAGQAFVRRVMALQGTSIGCTACPLLIQTIHDFKASQYADKAVFCAAHVNMNGQDPMTSYGSVAYASTYSMNSIPVMLLDLSTVNKLASNATVKMINAAIDARLETPAKCGIAARVERVGERVVVDAEVKVSVEGEYRICAVLLEDGIYAVQQDATGTITDENRDEMYTHNDAVRAIAPYDIPTGEAVGGVKQVAAGKYDFHCEFLTSKKIEQSSAYVEDITNCHVAVYVVRADDTVDNIINCPLGKSVAYEYSK